MPDLNITPPEETYSEEHLALVNALPSGQVTLGWLKAQPDPRLWQYADSFRESAVTGAALPYETDKGWTPALRRSAVPGVPDRFSRALRTGPVVDQALTPRCVCYSGGGVKQEQERKEHRRTYVVDADTWYAETKRRDPWGEGVDGTGIPYASEVARTDGVLLNDPRSKRDDPGGRRYKISAYAQLGLTDQIIEAIYRIGAVWFGISVDRGIFVPHQTDHGFVVPPPTGDWVGGHAMLATGFWQSMGWLEIKNSWGPDWGAGGFAWMPLTHFSAYPDWDAWTVTDEDDPRLLQAPA